jgi:hypothetical protein
LPGGCSAQLVRACALADAGGFDSSFCHTEDWGLWIRLAQLGPCAVVREPLVAYRMHEGSSVAKVADVYMMDFRRIERKHQALARARGVAPDGSGFTYWVATRQAFAGNRWKAAELHWRAGIRYRKVDHIRSALRALLGPDCASHWIGSSSEAASMP